MQSGQSPPQSVVKRIRTYGNALYKCHIILFQLTIHYIRVTCSFTRLTRKADYVIATNTNKSS